MSARPPRTAAAPGLARALARRAAKAAVLPMGIRGARRGDLTVLLYHRIRQGTDAPGREVDVAAAAFDRQMAWLAEAGTATSIDSALAPYLVPQSGGPGTRRADERPEGDRWQGQDTEHEPATGRASGLGEPSDQAGQHRVLEQDDEAEHGGKLKQDGRPKPVGGPGCPVEHEPGVHGQRSAHAGPRVVVTFDDGFHDFVELALPSLVAHGVPATLYLTTGLVSGEGPAAPDRLSWQDLRDAVSTGLVKIGAHTHTHPDLSRASKSQARDEMRRSRDLVEDRLGVACRHFAYPYSKSCPAAERVARELFDSAALAWGTNRAGRVDLHRLGRVPVLRSDGSLFFRAKVGGRLDGEALVYQALRRGPWRAS